MGCMRDCREGGGGWVRGKLRGGSAWILWLCLRIRGGERRRGGEEGEGVDLVADAGWEVGEENEHLGDGW